MNQQQNNNNQRLRKVASLMLALTLLPITVACGTKDQSVNVLEVTPASTSTVESSTWMVPTNTPNYKEVAETQIAERLDLMRTSIALTAAPTVTHGPPPTRPTQPPVEGIFFADVFLNRGLADRHVWNYWEGWLNNEWTLVDAGYLFADGEPKQGMIALFLGGFIPSQYYHLHDYYLTPQRLGEVAITSVNGTLVHLTTLDGLHAFQFDLATHQWEEGTPEPLPTIWTPGPSPSVSTSPMPSVSPNPSVSPLPTQMP